jgi:hypothetical protein
VTCDIRIELNGTVRIFDEAARTEAQSALDVTCDAHAMQVGIRPYPMRVPGRKHASPRRGSTRKSKEDGATAGGSTYSTRGCRAPRSEQARKRDERHASSVKARRFDRGLECPHSTSTDGDAESMNTLLPSRIRGCQEQEQKLGSHGLKRTLSASYERV